MQEPNILSHYYQKANTKEQKHFRDTWLRLTSLSIRSFYTTLRKKKKDELVYIYYFHLCTGKKYLSEVDANSFYPELLTIKSLEELETAKEL